MKLHRTTTLGLLTATLVFGGAVVACAGSEEPAVADIQPTEPAAAPAQTVPPAKPTPPPPAKVCVSSCQNDSQCASTCPETTGAVGCCDTRTGTCFANKGDTCPPPPPEDDGGTPSY